MDMMRKKELEMVVRRMSGIASVFDVRSSTVGNNAFSAFRTMMDAYIGQCERNMEAGHDFMDEPIKIDDEARADIKAGFEAVFGVQPGSE